LIENERFDGDLLQMTYRNYLIYHTSLGFLLWENIHVKLILRFNNFTTAVENQARFDDLNGRTKSDATSKKNPYLYPVIFYITKSQETYHSILHYTIV